MQSFRLPCVAVLWLVAATAASAASDPAISRLATHPAWLKLGHYERAGLFSSHWRSAVHPGDFFLAGNGSTDPAAELAATIEALNAAPSTEPDRHAQCRFPARLLWLKSMPQIRAGFRTDITCPGFTQWTRNGSVTAVSVVLATGYLGNPASYYGHMLLKFTYRDSATQTSLLDESTSYGAITEGRRDNPVVYILKSLTRGYDGGFSHIRFYFHDHHYGNQELRDMWEYRLDLSGKDRDLVVAHAWEVLDKRFTYEFFHGNCALRMAEVVEIADGVDITPHARPWIVPQAVTQNLAEARYNGRPLVAQVIYHPSRQSRFYARYRSLEAADRDVLRELATRETSLDEAPFQTLGTASKQAVIDSLLDYHQFVHNPLQDAPASARDDYAAALATRFQLPPGEQPTRTADPASPDLAHPPGWLQGAWAHNSATGGMFSLRVRAAYYDPLDFDSSHVRFGSLVMGDLQLDLLRDRVRVNRFDLVRVESASAGVSRLPGDRGSAWKLALGAEQARLACRDCLVARMQGDLGHSFSMGPLMLAAHAGAALQTGAAGQGWGFGRASASVHLGLGALLRARFTFEERFPVGGGTRYGVAQADLRWSWSRRGDLRIRYSRDGAHEVGVGLGIYW